MHHFTFLLLLFKMFITKHKTSQFYFGTSSYHHSISHFFMNLDDFIQPPYTIPLKYFKLYYNAGQHEKAACEIKYSFDTCLRLCTKEFIHALIEHNEDAIFCAIAYTLHQKKLNMDPLINPDDFLLACSICSPLVIAFISHHSSVTITPISNKEKISPLQKILDRDDPQLLYRCLSLVPELVETEPVITRSAPLYYILENGLKNLIDEMWILINAFEISESDLMSIIRNWNNYCPGEPLIPILEETFKNSICSHNLEFELYREKMFTFPAELTSITDLNCIDAKSNMEEAGKLRQFLTNRKAASKTNDEKLMFELIIDPNSPIILMQLPFALIQNPELLLKSELYLKKPLIGEEATGEGPVQDMFNAYFKQISSDSKYFDSSERATSILPTSNGENLTKYELHEKRCVFYGLGIVFLKVLIDLRNISNFQDQMNQSPLNQNINYNVNDNINNINMNNGMNNSLSNNQKNEQFSGLSSSENTSIDNLDFSNNEFDSHIINSTKDSLNYSLHPWIFQALLGKMQSDPKKLFHESLLFDSNFYNVMQNHFASCDTDIDNFVNIIKTTKMNLDSRPIFYEALHDGFYLNYIDGLTPSAFKDNLAYIKNELKSFYAEIEKVNPGALQLLLIGPPTINHEFLIDRFEFKPYKKYDSSGNGHDEEMLFLGENQEKGNIYKRSIDSFKEVMKEWCDEEGQHNIREFLRYLFGVPSLSPLHQQKWSICFDFSMDKSAILMTWACDFSVRSPLFKDKEHCKKVLLDSITNYQYDPVNRDMDEVLKKDKDI
ncbi:hypothetical protein TRFO_41282 [Tritrichomonas foetus]|uniref:HECT domain-containing protein n=1 Tax=Tritrichomonas foetus TaxID=1144522 RepID=A0A1J4L0Y9_9EUKA|nr:hypothetical protein TRFO_41282 [Tritrichomonas foetus]|eukprot:OHT17099.1 hypothetical protein TRFO_41282 [Tritrichomonas foetus]